MGLREALRVRGGSVAIHALSKFYSLRPSPPPRTPGDAQEADEAVQTGLR